MIRIAPTLQPYAWGDDHSIPELLGSVPSGEPVAEAWWGAHPASPARILAGADAAATLFDVIAADPVATLGEAVATRYGNRLPYLLKVLAIEKPLSIQIHPSRQQAIEGFAREESAGVGSGDPTRVYRDPNHKPEMVVAITPMTALLGFRPVAKLRADLTRVTATTPSDDARMDLERLAAATAPTSEPDAIADYVRAALTSLTSPRAVTDAVVAAADAAGAKASAALRAAANACRHFPGDGGVLVALAMNVVELTPGEAAFTPAGIVHSYQSGVGLEVMASSDNVIRAGLTPKHLDIDQLLANAITAPHEPHRPDIARDGATRRYIAPSREFALTTITAGESILAAGPRIVMARDGVAEIAVDTGEQLSLAQGEAAFVRADEGPATVTTSGTTIAVGVG